MRDMRVFLFYLLFGIYYTLRITLSGMASNYINLVDAESDDAEIQFIGSKKAPPICISSDEESPPVVLPPRKLAKVHKDLSFYPSHIEFLCLQVRANRTSSARPTPASSFVQVKVEPGPRPSSSVVSPKLSFLCDHLLIIK